MKSANKSCCLLGELLKHDWLQSSADTASGEGKNGHSFNNGCEHLETVDDGVDGQCNGWWSRQVVTASLYILDSPRYGTQMRHQLHHLTATLIAKASGPNTNNHRS